MSKWDRLVGVVGAFAAIVVVVDQYLVKSKLIDALLVPLGIPVGVIALVIVGAIVVPWFLLFSRVSPTRPTLVGPASNVDVADDLAPCREEKAKLLEKLADAESKLAKISSLRNKVIAILACSELSLRRILSEAGLEDNAQNRQDLLDIIGTLVQEGVVGRGSLSSDYKLLKQPDLRETGAGSKPVSYRHVIKLIHVNTGHALHSHKKDYSHPKSSRQQQVTAHGGCDANDFWLVKPQHGLDEYSKKDSSVSNGDIIRLEHINTRRNLHSHTGIPSPVSGQQEVTAFGRDGLGDTNDNWRVEIPGGRVWREKEPIRLIHVHSNAALHSHAGHGHGEFTAGQQEVTCFAGRDDNDLWFAAVSG